MLDGGSWLEGKKHLNLFHLFPFEKKKALWKTGLDSCKKKSFNCVTVRLHDDV